MLDALAYVCTVLPSAVSYCHTIATKSAFTYALLFQGKDFFLIDWDLPANGAGVLAVFGDRGLLGRRNKGMNQNMRGTIKWFHRTKHIGFLITNDGNREVFVHVNDCMGFSPEVGMPVEFEVGLDGKGRAKAVRIKRVVDHEHRGHEQGAHFLCRQARIVPTAV